MGKGTKNLYLLVLLQPPIASRIHMGEPCKSQVKERFGALTWALSIVMMPGKQGKDQMHVLCFHVLGFLRTMVYLEVPNGYRYKGHSILDRKQQGLRVQKELIGLFLALHP